MSFFLFWSPDKYFVMSLHKYFIGHDVMCNYYGYLRLMFEPFFSRCGGGGHVATSHRKCKVRESVNLAKNNSRPEWYLNFLETSCVHFNQKLSKGPWSSRDSRKYVSVCVYVIFRLPYRIWPKSVLQLHSFHFRTDRRTNIIVLVGATVF
jgi:hypothetical protein